MTESRPQDTASGTDAAPALSAGRVRRIVRLLTDFVLGQGAVQAIGIVIGLYLVRALSVSDYAKFGLASGFQFTTSVLMDLGYASTIIPLVGDRFSDRALVGRYVAEAKAHRDKAFWILAPFASLAFLWMTHRQHWDWVSQIGLLASVLLALYSNGSISYYGASLVLYRRLRAFYVPQCLTNVGRFVIYIALRLLGGLNALTAAGLNALSFTVSGAFLKRESRQSIEWPTERHPAIHKEIRDYILPAAPAILLGAFHGQIALFLISIWGSTVNVAQVAALGRLGQIFAVLMTFNVVVIEPYVARIAKSSLLVTYRNFVALAILGGALLSALAFLLPQAFLWILGRKYADLRDVIGWVVLTACINYVAGLMWIMNRSRKWVFWRGTIAEISLVGVVQIGYLLTIGVRTTKEAVMFNFVSSFCYVAAHLYVAVYGFRHPLHRHTPAELAPAYTVQESSD